MRVPPAFPLTRRTVVQALLGLALTRGTVAAATADGETALPRPASLPDSARAAQREGNPLVVLASLPGCTYCERIRGAHLLPLAREWGHGVVQLDLGSTRRVIGFDGAVTDHRTLLQAWRVAFAPTVLWLDAEGRELAPRLVGAGIPDFYGAYFDERLDTARRGLR